MITRRQAAQLLDIPLEMAVRHGLPAQMSEQEMRRLREEPPQWLRQSRENRTGKRPVWVELECTVCGFSETVRPKKWWPEFSFLACGDHAARQLPALAPGSVRSEYEGIGGRLFGYVDVPVGS